MFLCQQMRAAVFFHQQVSVAGAGSCVSLPANMGRCAGERNFVYLSSIESGYVSLLAGVGSYVSQPAGEDGLYVYQYLRVAVFPYQ